MSSPYRYRIRDLFRITTVCAFVAFCWPTSTPKLYQFCLLLWVLLAAGQCLALRTAMIQANLHQPFSVWAYFRDYPDWKESHQRWEHHGLSASSASWLLLLTILLVNGGLRWVQFASYLHPAVVFLSLVCALPFLIVFVIWITVSSWHQWLTLTKELVESPAETAKTFLIWSWLHGAVVWVTLLFSFAGSIVVVVFCMILVFAS